ncbi:MAG: family 16 glycosylhydrolase [Armatimonadota bacterium]
MMASTLTCAMLMLCFGLLASAALAQPPGPEKWEPFAALSDEFEGEELDAGKWHPTNPQWKGRKPGLFHPHNVTVSDGALHITMRREDLAGAPEGYHSFTCGAVKSKAKALYGYFEARCRAMKSRGSSAFWFYDNTPEIWTEIDVFEIGGGAPGHERKVHMNAHVFHTPTEKEHWAKGSAYEAPADLADDFHVYALKWTPKELTYYFDGAVVRTMENTHWHQPLYMNFDSETMPKWFGLPDEANLPSTFSIDYIRSWRLIQREDADE